MASPELVAGSTLGGYRIERQIGHGGMGVVYLARQLSLDRPVALKLIEPETAADPMFRERFLAESRLAASIDHPNVIPVHEAAEDGGRLYVAMRFVEGPDLGALLRAEGPLAPERAAHIVGQVAAALDAAHDAGLVHRDVKPANVLVASPGGAEHCYLTDFGLVKRAEETAGLTATGQVVGTPDYIAPEQLRGSRADRRADVYALGCLLYETLVGRPPFHRDTLVATLAAQLMDDPPAPSDSLPSLPRALDAVVLRALAKDPDQRYPTAGALARATLAAAGARTGDETMADTLPSGVVTMPTEAPAPARSRRRLGLVAAAGAVVVAAAAAAALLLPGGGEAPKPPATAKASLRVAGRTSLGGVPFTAAADGRRVWVTLEDEARLSILEGDELTQSAVYGSTLGAAAVAGGRLWVSDFGKSAEDNKGSLLQIDAPSGDVRHRLRTVDAYIVRAADDSVWLTDADRTVQRVDAGTGRITATRPVDRAMDLTIAGDRTWVVANGQDALVPFDTVTGEPAGRPVNVGARPITVAAAAGAIWAVTEPGNLVRVDPSTRKVQPTPIGPPGRTRVLAGNDDMLWIVDADGLVMAIDPSDPRRQRTLKLGGELTGVVADGPGAYVLRAAPDGSGSLVRVEPA